MGSKLLVMAEVEVQVAAKQDTADKPHTDQYLNNK
jgi:hypothetical protein